MNKNVRFYVLHNKNTGDVEFVESGNRLRMQDLMLRGYANIGSGECKSVSELNRGICSNMRGMYEYQKRQNDELKIHLERALQKLKEVHRISGLENAKCKVQNAESDTVAMQPTPHQSLRDSFSSRRNLESVRCQHQMFFGEQYRDVNSLPLRERISAIEVSKTQQEFQALPLQGKFVDEIGFGHLIRKFWEDVN